MTSPRCLSGSLWALRADICSERYHRSDHAYTLRCHLASYVWLLGQQVCRLCELDSGVVAGPPLRSVLWLCSHPLPYISERSLTFQSRCIIAMFWLAINSWSGGQFVQLMIISIWPSYQRLPNAVPASQGATTSDFLSFFIFWLLQLPFIFIHPSKLKLVFNIKAAVVPVVAIGTLIWVSMAPTCRLRRSVR